MYPGYWLQDAAGSMSEGKSKSKKAKVKAKILIYFLLSPADCQEGEFMQH